jgi:hypothetical protein
MSISTKRILSAAEQRMSTAGNITRTPDQAAKIARWGLSGSPVSQMPPADVFALSRMFDGIFPATMTEADIAEFGQINRLFEERC